MLNRRSFLETAGLGLGAVAIGGCTGVRKRATARPNTVVLYADDLGYGDIGVQNPNSKIPTPNLDRLAREGLRFTDGHSSSGICTPSRYALLTGRHHWRKFHGIVQPYDSSVFASERLTMPEMLKELDYETACVGKWHLGWDWEALVKPESRAKLANWQDLESDDFNWNLPLTGGPLDHGFDYYFGDDVPNFPPYTWIENDRILIEPTVPYEPNPVPEEGIQEGRPGPMAEGWQQDRVMPTLTEKAVEWISNRTNEQPFFLYFPWTSPHAPIIPAEEFKGRSDAGPYGDFVHQSDWTAGQVLKALDENGFTENTVVIFTSDNGPEHYAYDRIKNFDHRSMGPLRGLKRDIWEGGHRVPFFIRWPGRVRPGSVSDGLFSQVDLMATIASIVGYELPETSAEDSCDMLPHLLDPVGNSNIRDSHVHNTARDHYAIRKDNWVLIDANSGQRTRVPEWFDEQYGYAPNPHEAALYDLDQDIAQRHNLILDFPEKAEELRALLREIIDRGNSSPRLSLD